MRLQLVSLAVLTAADVTLVRFLADVRVDVIRQLRLHAEAQLAEVAFELLHAGVSISVHFQTPGSPVALSAIFTFIGSDAWKLNWLCNRSEPDSVQESRRN